VGRKDAKNSAVKWKKVIDLPDEVPVPDLLRTKLTRILRGSRAIEVREETAPGKFLQTNRLDVSNKQPHSVPSEPIDEIADAIATMMHGRWLEKYEDAENAESMRFRVQAIMHKDATKDTQSFIYEWDPDGSDSHLFQDPEDIARMEASDHYRDMVDRLQAQNEELHHVIIKQATMNAEPIAASTTIAQWGGQMAMQGMQAVLAASKMEYDREEIRVKAEQEKQNSERLWDRADKYLGFAIKAGGGQFAAWVKRKMGMRADEEEEIVTDDARSEAAGVDPPDRSDRPEPDLEAEAEDARANPLRTLAGLFSRTIGPQQRVAIRKAVGLKHFALLDDLFASTSEDEVQTAYLQIQENVPPLKLLGVHALLDDQQKMIFEKVAELVAARVKAQETPPPES